MDVQIVANVVVDKAELTESVHKETDPRAGCANHFCQSLLAQPGHDHFGQLFLAKTRHQQKDPRQPLFAGIEKLIDQVFLVADISLQQILDKHGRQLWFETHGHGHGLFLHMQQDAVGHGSGRRHA